MKSTTKILLLMLAVSIIGIGMPAAFSIGSGQHQFQQIDPNNPDAFCEKCHAGSSDIINAELMASGNGLYNGGGRIHAMVSCVDCHAVTQPGQTEFIAGVKTSHAAKIPTCTQCHVGTDAVMGIDVGTELSADTEAHKNFNDDTACIACHTSVAISGAISYTYSGAATRFGLNIGN